MVPKYNAYRGLDNGMDKTNKKNKMHKIIINFLLYALYLIIFRKLYYREKNLL